MDGREPVQFALLLLSANVPIYGLVTCNHKQFVLNNRYSSGVCFLLSLFSFFWGVGAAGTENEIRFKVIISFHSLDFECALMSLTKRGFIASPPGIAQSWSHILFMPAVYPIWKPFLSMCQGSELPIPQTPVV